MENSRFDELLHQPQLIVSWRRFCQDWDRQAFRDVIGTRYELGTLMRLLSFDDVEVRRAAAFAIGELGDYSVNNYLAQALHDPDQGVCNLAEIGLRQIWFREGTDVQRITLRTLLRANENSCYKDAYRVASMLIKSAPNIAEAWNQRAIASFALGNVLPTIRDCHEVLMRNPVHFSAAAGMGQIWDMIGNKPKAIRAFQQVLRIHPRHHSAREALERLLGSEWKI
ncbi:MAG: hypothetical protein PHE53_01990 [Thermoguttaceae bacterium]|nr:hypothetical protein [Thermoguttaceae bacterium]